MLQAARILRRSAGRAAFSTHPSESFLSGANSIYAEAMLHNYKKDPTSVHPR